MAEQEYESRHKFKDPNSVASAGVETKDGGTHEAGEVRVGKKWEFPVAVTKLGMLWGTIEESRAGRRILAFRGVKHVQPPVGELRFRPPVLAAKWEGIVEAKHNGHICPQHLATKRDTWVGDEDCLWLNVFTRDLVTTKRRPVIVWIHGGSFSRGSAAEYDPDYLLDEDVVLVTLQYRYSTVQYSTDAGHAAVQARHVRLPLHGVGGGSRQLRDAGPGGRPAVGQAEHRGGSKYCEVSNRQP